MLERLITLLETCWEALLPFRVIEQYQRAIVLRFGVLHRELAPGFHWRWPLVERVIEHTVVTSVHTLSPQSVTTIDGHSCVIQAVVTWRVRDVAKLLLDIEDADHALLDAAHGILAKHAAAASWAEIASADFLENASKEIRARSEERR